MPVSHNLASCPVVGTTAIARRHRLSNCQIDIGHKEFSLGMDKGTSGQSWEPEPQEGLPTKLWTQNPQKVQKSSLEWGYLME
jgi:hypothetical protein